MSGGTPPRLRELLERCLDKDPHNRLRDIGEARIVLEEALDRGVSDDQARPAAESKASSARRTPALLVAIPALLLGAVLGGLALRALAPNPSLLTVRRFEIPIDGLEAINCPPVISPDGQRIVYAAHGRLWVQSLDAFDARELPGTESATEVKWAQCVVAACF